MASDSKISLPRFASAERQFTHVHHPNYYDNNICGAVLGILKPSTQIKRKYVSLIKI
ncbi:MAG: hypothetical protein ACM3O3_01335 [Syntrophothermus sp.]